MLQNSLLRHNNIIDQVLFRRKLNNFSFAANYFDESSMLIFAAHLKAFIISRAVITTVIVQSRNTRFDSTNSWTEPRLIGFGLHLLDFSRRQQRAVVLVWMTWSSLEKMHVHTMLFHDRLSYCVVTVMVWNHRGGSSVLFTIISGISFWFYLLHNIQHDIKLTRYDILLNKQGKCKQNFYNDIRY